MEKFTKLNLYGGIDVGGTGGVVFIDQDQVVHFMEAVPTYKGSNSTPDS